MPITLAEYIYSVACYDKQKCLQYSTCPPSYSNYSRNAIVVMVHVFLLVMDCFHGELTQRAEAKLEGSFLADDHQREPFLSLKTTHLERFQSFLADGQLLFLVSRMIRVLGIRSRP